MNIHIVFKIFKQWKLLVETSITAKITLKEAGEDQSNLLVEIMNSKNKTTPQDPKKKKKKILLNTCMHFLMVEKEFLMLLKAKYFQ